jgi:hypothetical protein
MFIGVCLLSATHETPTKRIHWYKNWYKIHSLLGRPAYRLSLKNPTARRLTLAQPVRLDYCIYKQYR